MCACVRNTVVVVVAVHLQDHKEGFCRIRKVICYWSGLRSLSLSQGLVLWISSPFWSYLTVKLLQLEVAYKCSVAPSEWAATPFSSCSSFSLLLPSPFCSISNHQLAISSNLQTACCESKTERGGRERPGSKSVSSLLCLQRECRD